MWHAPGDQTLLYPSNTYLRNAEAASHKIDMSPIPHLYRRVQNASGDQSQKPTDPNGLVLEAWAEGYMIGSLIIMTCITIANMRRGVLLHKLILIEVSEFHCDRRGTGFRLTITVDIWLLARSFHSVQPPNIRLVAVGRGHTSPHFLVAA